MDGHRHRRTDAYCDSIVHARAVGLGVWKSAASSGWMALAIGVMQLLVAAYDMLTTSVYAGFQHNPPGIEFMGKKTWTPGKNLQKFIAATFGIQPREQQHMVQAISDAVADVGPQVRAAMTQHPGFEDIGKRMLMAWADGVQGLRDQRVYAVGDWTAGDAFEGFSAPPKLKTKQAKIGRSPLLGDR